MVDVAIVQDLIRLAFPLAVGVIALLFYIEKKKSGMLVIAIAFFLNAVTDILFGSTMIQYFFDIGWSSYAYGLYSLVIGLGFTVVFTVLMVLGLFLLYKEMK